jgi:hypothetical protein
VIGWLPAVSDEVVNVATPLAFTAVGPSRVVVGLAHVPPSINVTFPVVTPGVTVAVKITEPPKVDGFEFEARPVVVVTVLAVPVPLTAIF